MILTEFQKNEIIIKYNMNMTLTNISKTMNISKPTVHLWIKKYKLQKDLIIEKGRGRKKILTEQQESFIINLMDSNKFWKVPKLKNELFNLVRLELSEDALINILKRNKFTYHYHQNKHFLSDKHKNMRLQFALNNIDTNWFNVIFSDESIIIKDQHTGKYWI